MHDIVVVGGSAGALEGLIELLQDVPESLDASVHVVLHSTESGLALVPGLLQRRSRLAIHVAADGDPVRRGHVYVPPPDHHLMLQRGRVIVNRGPKQNRFRPAIDPLFVSAAATYGPRVVGILLSGLLDDGVHGLSEIRKAGGIVVVQDPADAPVPALPQNALRVMRPDHVVAASGMGPLVMSLSTSAARKTARASRATLKKETRVMQSGPTRIPGTPPSPFTCPDCDGALWLDPGETPLFRCHVGHAYTPSALLAGQKEVSDQHMWKAVRSLEEQAEMHRRFVPAAAHAGEKHNFHRHAAALEERALILRRILIERGPSREPRPASTKTRSRTPGPRTRAKTQSAAALPGS